jgi:hypothetical protein
MRGDWDPGRVHPRHCTFDAVIEMAMQGVVESLHPRQAPLPAAPLLCALWLPRTLAPLSPGLHSQDTQTQQSPLHALHRNVVKSSYATLAAILGYGALGPGAVPLIWAPINCPLFATHILCKAPGEGITQTGSNHSRHPKDTARDGQQRPGGGGGQHVSLLA